jgi:hypothetical protein
MSGTRGQGGRSQPKMPRTCLEFVIDKKLVDRDLPLLKQLAAAHAEGVLRAEATESSWKAGGDGLALNIAYAYLN